MKKRFTAILITSSFLTAVFVPHFVLAQETQSPQTIEEAKSFGLKILDRLPQAVMKVWREQALPQLRNMWGWAKGPLESLWNRFLSLLGKEIEKRKPVLEEEFQKEKKEMKEDAPKAGQSIWERFKQLIE